MSEPRGIVKVLRIPALLVMVLSSEPSDPYSLAQSWILATTVGKNFWMGPWAFWALLETPVLQTFLKKSHRCVFALRMWLIYKSWIFSKISLYIYMQIWVVIPTFAGFCGGSFEVLFFCFWSCSLLISPTGTFRTYSWLCLQRDYVVPGIEPISANIQSKHLNLCSLSSLSFRVSSL